MGNNLGKKPKKAVARDSGYRRKPKKTKAKQKQPLQPDQRPQRKITPPQPPAF